MLSPPFSLHLAFAFLAISSSLTQAEGRGKHLSAAVDKPASLPVGSPLRYNGNTCMVRTFTVLFFH
jgi:hypothetical protein